MTLVRGVIWLAPIGVVALVLPLAAHAGPALVGAIGFYIVAYSGAVGGRSRIVRDGDAATERIATTGGTFVAA